MVFQAERLRTRLQLAYYKVQTNQATVPFGRLRPLSRSTTPQRPIEPVSSSPQSSPPAPQRPSPETRIAIMRAKATMQAKKAVKPLESMPAPQLAPTAFSARNMEEAESTSQQIPSSPPLSHSAGTRHGSADAAHGAPTPKPNPASHNLPHTPVQLSSPPGSPEHGKKLTTTQKLKRQDRDETYKSLTSSVVKGDAANSLLELMKGAQKE